MRDAVCAADGLSYERSSLERHFYGASPSALSPCTGAEIRFAGYVVNHSLRCVIAAWRKDPTTWENVAEEELLCNITMDTMTDPVLTLDGHSYERNAIMQWLKRHSTSPRSNTELASRALFENTHIRLLAERLAMADPNTKGPGGGPPGAA